MNQASAKPRLSGWILLGLVLCIRADYDVSDNYRVYLLLALFLPLVTATVAYRYGKRVFTVLTVLAVPGMFTVGWSLTDRMYISIDIRQWAFLLSIVTAVAFCRPATSVSTTDLINDRYRWTRWLMPVALWLMLYRNARFDVEIYEDAYLETNIGAIALAVLLALTFNWRAFIAAFRELVLTSERRWANWLRAAIWVLFGASIVINANWEIGYVFSGAFGFSDAISILIVAVLTVSALGKVDWRIAVLAVAAIIVTEALTEPLHEWIETTITENAPPAQSAANTSDGPALESIVVTGAKRGPAGFILGYYSWFTLVSTVCFGLLGAAIAPAWRHRNPELLKTRRTAVFLAWAVAIAFVAVPLGLSSREASFSLALVAAGLLMGYRWRYRAVVLAPLVLIFAFLSIGFAFAISFHKIPSALHAIDIGIVTFPATFIGVLLNRYSPVATPATTFEAGSK